MALTDQEQAEVRAMLDTLTDKVKDIQADLTNVKTKLTKEAKDTE